jgi:hypothetical protein
MVGEEVGPGWFPEEDMGPRRRWALGGSIRQWGEEFGMVGRQEKNCFGGNQGEVGL